MKVCEKCGSEQKDEGRFCSVCGHNLVTTSAGDFWCVNCTAEVSEADEVCKKCGSAVLRGNLKIQEKLSRIEGNVDLLDQKLNFQIRRIDRIVKILETAHLGTVPDVVEPSPQVAKASQVPEEVPEPIVPPGKVAYDIPPPIKVSAPVKVSPPVQVKPLPTTEVIGREHLDPPTLPALFPRFSAKDFVTVDEIQIEKRKTKVFVGEQSLAMKVFSVLTNQVQPIVASGLLIGAFMLLAISLQLSPVFQGLAFGVIGLFSMFMGHAIISGRVFGIDLQGLRSREVGIFLVNFGMGLGLGVAWVTGGSVVLRLLPSLVYIGVPAYLGYLHRSDFTKSLVIIAILADAIVLSTSGLPWLMQIGGVLPIGIALIYLYLISKQDVSFAPVLILMVGGPLIVVVHSLAVDVMFLPSLGIVLSLFPVAYFLMRGFVDVIKPYYYTLYSFFFLWPVVAFSIILAKSSSGFPVDPVILFAGLAIAFHLSTSVMHGKFEGTEILRDVSQRFDRIAKIYVPVLGSLVILYQQLLLAPVGQGITIFDFIMGYVVPQFLLVFLFVVYVVFVHWSKFWTRKGSIAEKWASILVCDLSVLVSTIWLNNEGVHLGNPAVIVMATFLFTAIVPFLGVLIHLFAGRWIDREVLLAKTNVVAIANGFLLTVGFIEGAAALAVTLVSLSIFLVGLLLPHLEGVQRKSYYQVSLIGNFIIVVFGQLLGRYDRIEIEPLVRLLGSFGISTVGPFVVFAIYASFSGFSFLFLNKIIPHRTTADIDFQTVITNPMMARQYVGQKFIEYQELIFSVLLNLSFIVFLVTDGFIMGEGLSYLPPTAVSLAFMLVNAITIYNSRGRHWGTLVPAYASFLATMAYVSDSSYSLFVQFGLIFVYSVSLYVSYLDGVKKRPSYLARIFWRDAIAWVVFLLMLLSANLSAFGTIVTFAILLLGSLFVTMRYGQYVLLGLAPVLLASLISHMPSAYDTSWATDLNYFMAILILLAFASLNFLRSLQSSEVEDFKIFGLNQDLLDNVRKALPVFSAIFLIKPKTFEGLAISHVWFFILTLLVIGTIEMTGFDRRKLIGVLPLLLLNFIVMPESGELWQTILLLVTYGVLVGYSLIRSSFFQPDENEAYHVLLSLLSAAIFYAFALDVPSYPEVLLVAFAVGFLLHTFESLKSETTYRSVAIAVFISSLSVVSMQVGIEDIPVVSLSLFALSYIALGLYLFVNLFYKQDLPPHSMATLGAVFAFIGLVNPVSIGTIEAGAIILASIGILMMQYRNFELTSTVFVQLGFLVLVTNLQGIVQDTVFAGFVVQLVYYRLFKDKEGLSILDDRIKLYQYVLLPIPLIASISLSNPISQVIYLSLLGILSVINEIVEDHDSRGLSAIGIALFTRWMATYSEPIAIFGQNLSEGLFIPSFIALAGAIYLFKTFDESLYFLEKQILAYLVFIFVSFGINEGMTTFFMGLPLAVVSFSLWTKTQTDREDIIDVSFLAVSPLLFLFTGANLAFVPLVFFFLNLVLTCIKSVLRKTTGSLVRLAWFGFAHLVEGMFLGGTSDTWEMVAGVVPQIVMDYAWVTLLAFWLISINILISGLTELDVEGMENISAYGLGTSTSIFVMALASLMWINLSNIISLFLLLAIGSFLLLIAVSVNGRFAPVAKRDFTIMVGSILALLVSLRIFSFSFIGAYDTSILANILTGREMIAYFVFLPVSLTMIPLTLRVVANRELSNIIVASNLDLLLFATVGLTFFWFPNFGDVAAGVVVLLWSLFVVSASLGRRETSVISSALMFIMTFLFGRDNQWLQKLSLGGVAVDGGAVSLLVVSALMFAYLWKLNFENVYNTCHDIVYSTTVGTTVLALMLMADLTTTAGRAIFFNGLVLLSVSTMAYAVKFSMRKYEILATVIIYGALLLGIGALIVLGASGTLNLPLTMLTLFTGGLGFLINMGLQNIEKLMQRAKFLQMFAPREVSSNE